MIEIRRTAFFDIWLNGMRDIAGKVRIIKRLERAQQGNLGDIAPVARV